MGFNSGFKGLKLC